MAFTSAEHGVWWLVLGLGVGIGVLGLLSTGRWALRSAQRAAALFDGGEEGVAEPAVPGLGNIRTAPIVRRSTR